MLSHDQVTWWQGDREIFPQDIAYIRAVAKRFPGLSRTELTCTLCEHLGWLTAAGQPKFTACSKLLVRLEEAGEVQLPAIREVKGHPGRRFQPPKSASAQTDHLPVEGVAETVPWRTFPVPHDAFLALHDTQRDLDRRLETVDISA